MRVDQAMYGTVKNGHGLRCASGDGKLASDLAQRLDLPDTEPPGADWSPVTSGFAVRDRYVIARTMSDPSAGRSGMVLTHALICSLEDIVAIDDLRALLDHLITSPGEAPAAVEPLDVAPGRGVPSTANDLADTARALVLRGTGPVVRIGTDGFEELIVALWGRLWPALRRGLYFRLSFGPKDIVEEPAPTIVCTPTSLVGRWQQHRIIGRNGSGRSRAGTMIDGSDEGARLREYGSLIGASLDGFGELQLLEQAHAAVSSKPDSVASLVSAARLMQRLSPDPQDGEAEKRSTIERLARVLPAAEPSEILRLRNLSLDGLPADGLVWEAVEAWLERNPFSASTDADMVAIITDALVGEDAVAPWRDAARRGLVGSARTAGGAFEAGFWRWAKADPRVSQPLLALVAGEQKGLEALVAGAPGELDVATAKPIIDAAAKLGLFRLHAVTAGTSMTAVDAARAQIAVEPGDDASAMRLALRGAKPDEILDAAAAVADARLLRIAGEAVAEMPGLLAERDMSTDVNRRIWATALRSNPDAWRGPTEPRHAFDAILAEQIDGRHPPIELLDRLSSSPLADATSFPRRGELWRHLPTGVRDRLLAATTDAWFGRIGTGGQDLSAEPELVESILHDPRLDQLLARLSAGQIGRGLRIIDALGGVDPARFRGWIAGAVRSTRPLLAEDADLVGRSVAARGRSDVVDDLISVYRGGRGDLEPALRHCLGLIGFFDRWLLGLSPVSDTEKWGSLVGLATQLYPNGPDQEGLWERSGGRDADLNHHGTGGERWRAAIRCIQNGKPPRASRLVREMLDDFTGNANLRVLANDPLFRR